MDVIFLYTIGQLTRYQRFPEGFVFKSPWHFHGIFGGLTDRVGDSFNILWVLCQNCASDAHLRVREKHAVLTVPVFEHMNIIRLFIVENNTS